MTTPDDHTLNEAEGGVGMSEFNVKWKRGTSEDVPCWKTPWATVWDNGVWHTWDCKGNGGENSSEPSVVDAMAEAMKAAYRQGFIALPGDDQ